MANNKETIKQIRDCADCADASYAMLHYVFENEESEMYDSVFNIKRWKGADNVKFGDKIKENITDSNGNILHKEN